MAQSTEQQLSFEDVLRILSQAPAEKLLSLKLKLKHFVPGPCSKLLQALLHLTLGQETDARICLDALRGNGAAQYVQQIRLGAAGGQEDREGLQPPQLDAGAMALLAQVYAVLAQEELCSPRGRDKTCHDTQQGTLNNIPPKEEHKQGPAATGGSGDRISTLRCQEEAGFPHPGSSQAVRRSSPVHIEGISELSGPRTLCSAGSPSLSSCLEISASPTVAFHTQPCVPEGVPSPRHPEGDTQSQDPQESSWASTGSPPPGQDRAAQGPRPEEGLQPRPCHSTPLPVPSELPLPSEPAQSSDVSSTVTEPPTPRERQDEEQDGKKLSAGVPEPRAAVDTAPAHGPTEDSSIPQGISCNSVPASISTCSLPPPTYSFTSALPPLQEPHSNLFYPPPLHSIPSPAWSPPLPDPDGAKFFSFVVLHAREDEIVAQELRTQLESMGVPNGATLSEDFFIAGRSHLTCFQDAMENSAFIILLLTKNFPCNLCLFQTDTALMQSIQEPSKQYSVIPFLPKANALERSQIPKSLSALIILDESSAHFCRNVKNTFNPRKIREKKALWEQMQSRKLQVCWERQQAQQNLAGLRLGSPPWVPPAEPPAQPWCPPAPRGPPPAQAQLPPGHYNITPGQGGIPQFIIKNASMVQIGNHNLMQVGAAPAGPGVSQEQTRPRV